MKARRMPRCTRPIRLWFLGIPPGSYFFSLGLRVATGCWRSARDRQHGVTPHQGVDRGWIGPWTKSLAHLKVQRYQCCASDDLSSCRSHYAPTGYGYPIGPGCL